jgi:hypothetical protein
MPYFTETTQNAVQRYLAIKPRGRVVHNHSCLYPAMSGYSVECKDHPGVWYPVVLEHLDPRSVVAALDDAFDRCYDCRAYEIHAKQWATTKWTDGAEL